MGNVDRMDSLEAVETLDPVMLRRYADERSYLWFRGLIERRCILALRRLVLERIRAGTTDPIRLQCEILPRPEFDAIRRHAAVLGVLEALLGGTVEAERGDVLRVVEPGAEPTPPHQDACYTRRATVMWSAWVPLGDCPLSLGPLAVWPSSHRCGLLPHGASGLAEDALARARWAASGMACGDVLLLHHHTAHRSLPNQAGEPRLSIDCRYVAA
jgi:Phytanoyl-CoA dioxygenase (PhyH)